NFKSIDSLEVTGLPPFTVFAGPNGSGKSNFFDALDFVSLFIRNGLETALRAHGGFSNIHSEKHREKNSREFDFEIEYDTPEKMPGSGENIALPHHYILGIQDLEDVPKIEEELHTGNVLIYSRKKGESPKFAGKYDYFEKPTDHSPPILGKHQYIDQFIATYSSLLLSPNIAFTKLLSNINLYRIDPIGAKQPSQSDYDPTKLDRSGHNLASVLGRMEANSDMRETILDWMEMIAPGIEKIETQQQALDGRTALVFKEQGTGRPFPAHMISDGTIYALCLLVAVLDSTSNYGMTLIEEPERGLHPKAIREIIDLMRQQASPENPIWLTTHSESVVRALKLDELVLVDKVDGRTRMKRANSGNLTHKDLAPLGLDEAWLSNLFGSGLPW
ncbi:MAG: AAA family ATPase, partial [Gammaproteobacteria bacterium]|nr:AAA family ATPase [Gammaproteobacteria bacterium]